MTKGFRVLTTFVLTVLASVSLFAISVHAASAEELNARWYTTKDYPATPDDKEWRLHDFSEWIDILNPPEDLLKEFTSEELAKLLLRYPYLINYGCYDEEWMFFDFMGQSAIYEELFRREDGIHEMLIAFQDNEIDYELLDKEPLAVYGRDLGALADQFVCQYMRFHWEFIPDEEKLLYIEIAEKKKLNYAELKEEEPEKYLCGLLLFFEKESYSKPNEIVSARYDSMIVAGPNYQGTMITESKNGCKGVYRAKYSDMMRFYRGAYYKVFRQY